MIPSTKSVLKSAHSSALLNAFQIGEAVTNVIALRFSEMVFFSRGIVFEYYLF